MATHQKKHIQNKQSKYVEFILRSEKDNEEYAEVVAAKGSDARFEVTILTSGINVMAKARGSLIKGPRKKKIEKGNIVLIQRDNTFTAEDKYFIIHKYDKNDVDKLEKSGEFKSLVPNSYNTENIGIDLDDIDDEFISNI